jgi:hypothetical protein
MHILSYFLRYRFGCLGASLMVFVLVLSAVHIASAQIISEVVSKTTTNTKASTSASTTPKDNILTQNIQVLLEAKDLTRPEKEQEKEAILQLLEKRPIESPGLFSFGAWWVQHSIRIGVPANTIVLILLLPILAALVAFMRVIIGLPSLEMLVPIALAYVFTSVGVIIGSIILVTVVIASFISRIIMRRISIMHYPKRSLSMLLLALTVFAALSVSIQLGIGNVQELSIFPILILTLLGDSIVSVQLHKSMREAFVIISVTIALGLFGYLLATLEGVRNILILYPEVVLIMIPINIVMGRYFGLRLSEVFRFHNFNTYASE